MGMDAAEAGRGRPVVAGVPHSAHDLLERIAELTCRMTGADDAALLFRSKPDGTAFAAVATHGASARRLGGPLLERALTAGETVASDDGDGYTQAAAPLAWGGSIRGVLVMGGSSSSRRFGRPDLELLSQLADLTSVALDDAARSERLEEIVDAGVAALVRAVDMRDDYTGRHSESVGELARRVGERMGMHGFELWLLELAARLHDVGKIGVPDAVLNKPGPLDESEWVLMRRHAELGAEMVSKVPGLEAVAPLVRAHHERWDGRGYPDGLASTGIPLASRVIAACDSFQAMTAERPYRAALDVDEALAELAAGSGSQFDPEVVTALRDESAPALEVRASAAARR
jgi:hypothetical protein